MSMQDDFSEGAAYTGVPDNASHVDPVPFPLGHTAPHPAVPSAPMQAQSFFAGAQPQRPAGTIGAHEALAEMLGTLSPGDAAALLELAQGMQSEPTAPFAATPVEPAPVAYPPPQRQNARRGPERIQWQPASTETMQQMFQQQRSLQPAEPNGTTATHATLKQALARQKSVNMPRMLDVIDFVADALQNFHLHCAQSMTFGEVVELFQDTLSQLAGSKS